MESHIEVQYFRAGSAVGQPIIVNPVSEHRDITFCPSVHRSIPRSSGGYFRERFLTKRKLKNSQTQRFS